MSVYINAFLFIKKKRGRLFKKKKKKEKEKEKITYQRHKKPAEITTKNIPFYNFFDLIVN